MNVSVTDIFENVFLSFVLSDQESHVKKIIKADLLKAEITENRCEQVK
jgi:hypothetical protein